MEKLSEDQFNAIRAYPDYAAYQADYREIVSRETTDTIMVEDSEIVAAVRALLTAEESARFTDERVASNSQYARGSNRFRETIEEIAQMCRDSAARQVASEAKNAAEEEARLEAAAEAEAAIAARRP